MNIRQHLGSRRRKWVWAAGLVVLAVGLYIVVTDRYREEEKDLRVQFRQAVKKSFPEQAEQFSTTIGLFAYESETGQLAAGTNPDRETVVLIHGLDDPGKVWQNLAPALAGEGFDVWQMHYPNDQPVVESTQLFFDELQKLRQSGVRRISIVAHSMGGLVTRELLTSPMINYRQSVSNQLVPAVNRFIMAGTPNHGSQLARFRFFAEFRDHLERLRKGEANWLGSILDGAGEAKIDLLPQSRFLTELNGRPHPGDIDTLIIAGITSPWNEDDISQWQSVLQQIAPEGHRNDIDMLGRYMVSMTHGLGDGLVTVDSTRLTDIPHLTVNGTHLTMIRNIGTDSQRIPPAVPIIVETLKQ